MEEHQRPCSALQSCLNAISTKAHTCNKALSRETNENCIIKGKIIIQHSHGESAPRSAASVQLYSRSQVDPKTGKGKMSEMAELRHGKTTKHSGVKITTFDIKFLVTADFGIPGAFAITNKHKHKFFLQSATLKVSDYIIIHFDCNSWVYPVHRTKTNRLFFSNTSYLPSQTPNALVQLRKEELVSLRGDGTRERKEWERIYDYDFYNDLGNKEPRHARPILGGSLMYPYPRRGKTGLNGNHGTITLDMYVPPDERVSPQKLSELISNSIQAGLHFILPEAKLLFTNASTGSFESFDEICDLFTSSRSQVLEGWVAEKLKSMLPPEIFKKITRASKKNRTKFPLPQVIAENELAWKDDEEFGRQMLAGINPAVIQCLGSFPPRSKDGVWSSIKQSHIESNLDGLTLEMAINQWRIFILDHHDYLMPFLSRINTKGVCAYASRTLLFLRKDSTLKPLAIELSLPTPSASKEKHRVFLPSTHGSEAAVWQLAKAHVASNDACHHQLISHWLKAHAVVEPFIIATRRQLSTMHPIHRLLDPHFKDTMHINAIARSVIVNGGGILEKTLSTGEISMELTSAFYKDWRFDEQGLPADLVKRCMALPDPNNPGGVQLIFEDYPYGADGLDIWVAIKAWVTNFCSIFYTDDNSLRSDDEIQSWWSEIRNLGHGDKHNETWWYPMKTLNDLIEALTTLIWTASALHASVNFGQYGYTGCPPNRPTLCRKFIPKEGTLEFAEFLRDPDKYYLSMLPEIFELTLSVAVVEVLSRHTSDEVYLGQRLSEEWTDNEQIQQIFQQFQKNLQEVEKRILERNRNPNLKNRCGPAKIAYKLLYPDTSNVGFKGGITGKGIPNSISI
ncbi:probable linoleate 9S-lipoxygenase 7 isoform X2 [Rhododendron vialii]|uniref:probable linoleate 9S-lipoxygenase 7 isoform X2 n=1 Tax=Rhododendron vialii TaxID=182163 RepID=UPI00265DFACD|nr:probable linoleate 9S-lipoxygenase 7 isoform X2 [Rhododendron vialii]